MDKTSISKQLITLCILDLDYCDLTYGVSPCTATGTPKCYNTFKTCTDKTNFDKTTKQYRFINNSAPPGAAADLNALPYILDNSPLSTELKDDKTIPARGTVTFGDEVDYDQGVDPYWSDRRGALIDGVGNYFKKLIERNPYYKGRIITIKQGYTGQAENAFETIFSGKIETIKREGVNVKIDYADDIVDLAKIEYPYKTNIKLTSDLGKCWDVKTDEELIALPASLNDYALFRGFDDLLVSLIGEVEGLPNLQVSYIIIAYDQFNNPMARWERLVGYNDGDEELLFSWEAYPGTSYYRIYEYSILRETYTYDQFTDPTYECTVDTDLPNEGTAPTEAERYFKYAGIYTNDLNMWEPVTAAMTADISTTSGLDTSGYIQLNDEVIYYTSLGVNQLSGLRRIRYKSKSVNHYAGTNLKLVDAAAPGNPFTLLKTRAQRAGIPDSRIDIATMDAYAALYTSIDYSTLPIIKSTNAGKIYFDLANALDVASWVNEEGKLTCKKNDDETVDHTINDAENIVLDSRSIDFNDDEIRTHINFYWNRNDVTKGLDDKENYKNLHIEINADAEGANMYNQSIPENIITTWINDDGGTIEELNAAIQILCDEKLRRMAAPRPKLTFDVELKDSAIKVGDIVSLTSDAFNDVDGNDYQNKKAQVIKKTPKGLLISLTVRLLATDSITTTSEDHVLVYENPKAVKDFGLNEIKVTNLKIYDIEDNEYTDDDLDVDAEIKLKLKWDNMYMSEAGSATDINGVTKTLPKRLIYSGYPPAPSSEEVDTSSWKSVRSYKVYLFVGNTGEKYPATLRPTVDDANGKWFVIGKVLDLKVEDGDKKYLFEYNIPISLVGRFIGFDVYADANLVYDSNAPVSIDVGVLQ